MRGLAPLVLSDWPPAEPAFPERQIQLSPSSLDCIFRPRSVALVGASSRVDAVGRQILDNLLDFGYPGRIYPVNPKAEEIRGLRCYPSVASIGQPVDVAVLVVPRGWVPLVAEDCLAAGVGGVVVVAGGFRELSGFLVQEMVASARELILGFRRDEQGTPLLVVGLGGILVEALDAVAVRVVPTTDQDVHDMLREMPGARVLGAFRGMLPVAKPKLEESLLRLSQLASDFSEISEIDLNPFVVSAHPAECEAVDTRILLTE